MAKRILTSRQIEKPRGKKKNLTANRITSRQIEKPHDKSKRLTAKRTTSQQPHRETFYPSSFAMSLLLLPWGFSFCREVIPFVVTVVGHHKLL